MFVFLVLWTPFGLLLLAFRIMMFFVCALLYGIAHKCGFGVQWIRFIQPIFGALVRVDGLHHLKNSKSPLIVANHVSDFDACMVWAGNPPGEQILVVNEHWRPVISTVQFLGWPINPIYTTEGNTKEAITAALSKEAKSASGRKMLLFPEGRTTSGITVMTFFDFAFTLDYPVIPCTVEICNPWPIQMQCNGCSVISNLAAFYFLPCVWYKITFYQEVGAGGQSQERATFVRKFICERLNVPVTTLGAKDKVAFAMKRKATKSA